MIVCDNCGLDGAVVQCYDCGCDLCEDCAKYHKGKYYCSTCSEKLPLE